MAPPLPWLWTVNQVLNAAAVECGLDEAADAYASTLTHFKQLRALLKTCGLELIGMRDWRVLTKEASFTGDGVTTTFDVPSDFARFVDGSGWRRADQQPMEVVSSAQWQWLKAWTATAQLSVQYRLVAGRVQFYTAPANGAVQYSDYISRYWIAATASSAADKRDFTATDDVVMFDPLLITKMLKWKLLEMKGLPQAAGAAEEYGVALNQAINAEPAPDLSLSGGFSMGFVGEGNYPVTGFGT